LRPPWLLDANSFTEACTRCGACIERCPEQILQAGDGGFPHIDFSRGECTFCGECTGNCEAGLFVPRADQRMPAWPYKAQINFATCLTGEGVHCRSCEDYCEPRAIRFPPVAGGVPQPVLKTESCTGCGSCVAHCPPQAIAVGEI
jgi:ferredoxin-type protein NapF